MSSKRHWLLSCGHTVSMLEHERPEELPPRPRMCPSAAGCETWSRRPTRCAASLSASSAAG